MNIKLYNYTGDKIVVNKAGWLTNATLYASMDGNLKEDTDLMNPSVTIENSGVPAANYAYIAALGRYYFINNIVCLGATLWRLDMHVDVLMTYAGTKNGGSSTGIYALQAYIDRSAQASGTFLVDTAYPMMGKATRSTFNGLIQDSAVWAGNSSFLNGSDTNLHYLILYNGVSKGANGDYNSDFVLAHVLTTASSLFKLFDMLNSQNPSITGNKYPTDYIVGMKYIPKALTMTTSSDVTKMDFPGLWSDLATPGTGTYVQTSDRYYDVKWKVSVTAPSTVYKWKNFHPYTSVTLTFMPFGRFVLDNSLIFAAGTSPVDVYVRVRGDVMTGDACLYYGMSSSAANIYLGTSNVNMDVPLNVQSYSLEKIVSGAAAMTFGVARVAAGDIIGGVTGVLSESSVFNAADSAVSAGHSKIIDNVPVIEVINHPIEGVAANLLGYPDGATTALYTYTGYTKVGRVHVSNLPGTPTADEIDEVEQLLLAGVEL
mgnify:CR=1 FL=1